MLLITGTVASAQVLTSSTRAFVPKPTFDSLLNLYSSNHKLPVLYVHFDKNIYSSNETVWFTGYLLNANGRQTYGTLALALVKDEDRSVLTDGRFVINNGFCFGNATIPDSVNAGAYTLVAYGNRVSGGLPDVVFNQQITIKTGFQSTYNASLNPLDTSATADNQKVMLLVNFMNAKSAPKSVAVKYYVGDARDPVTTGEVKTTNGQYIFNIPSAVLHANNNKLHVQVKHKAEVQDLSMALPVPPQPAQLLFFPEGGNIVNGLVNTVGWELKSPDGTPIVASAVLFEDKQVLDTVHNNSSGMGRFTFIHKKNKQYYLKLIDQNNTNTYNLPPAVDGPALRVYRAVVNDTLIVDVHNDNPRRKLFLIGHNYRQTLFEAVIAGRDVQRLKVILNAVPRGLLQLTLVDSMGRPYAERLVFAHYANASKLEINTDTNSYVSRKKVSLSIKLNGEADAAAVSVAVVQANRVELRNKSDIESYVHLRHQVGDLPLKENFFSGDAFDRRDLEDVLLVKGWSRYKWTDVLRAGENDAISTTKELTLGGKVTRIAGKFKAPVTLITLAPGGMYETDVNGFFNLPDSNIVTAPNKDIGIMVANNNTNYKVTIINPYDSVSRALALNIDPIRYNLPAQQSSADLGLSGNERTIQLKEVVIKDRKVDSFYNSSPPKTEKVVINTCPDYYCQYGILNCPNHRPPGCMLLMTLGNSTQEEKPQNVVFKGIYTAQEFYPVDYSEISPSQPEYLSTIYWKNQLLLKKGEAQEVSFYTSDITGQFKIIVQGITDDDVIYGEATFNVKK